MTIDTSSTLISSGDQRIFLAPSAGSARALGLETAMLGHCPGTARWQSLLDMPDALAALTQLGYQRCIERLRDGSADARLQGLFDIPLPVHSPAQFHALFPDAADTGADYRSRLAGDHAWLPKAVADFFLRADDTGRRLWVIRIDQALQVDGFLPQVEPDLSAPPDTLSGLAVALQLPEVGLLALPDLERLLIPAELRDIPRLRLPNPTPGFLPCASAVRDDHRERRNSWEMPHAYQAPPLAELLPRLLGPLRRHRPDLHCLLAVPLHSPDAGELPAADQDLLAVLRQHRIAGMEQLQWLFPYLRDRRLPLFSPAGLIAGQMVERTRRAGPWYSIAGRPLPGDALPWPPQTRQQATSLRESPGIGVLLTDRNRLLLDDERLAVPVFPGNADGSPSGEVARFIGWLRRALRRLGERLIFDVDPRDPRPLLALTEFFTRLHARGALRGRLPEQAFTIRQLAGPENVIAFDIELAPAIPIDHIRVHLAGAAGGSLGVEVSDG